MAAANRLSRCSGCAISITPVCAKHSAPPASSARPSLVPTLGEWRLRRTQGRLRVGWESWPLTRCGCGWCLAGATRVAEHRDVCGIRRVWKQLQREGYGVARCTVARLMRRLGLAR